MGYIVRTGDADGALIVDADALRITDAGAAIFHDSGVLVLAIAPRQWLSIQHQDYAVVHPLVRTVEHDGVPGKPRLIPQMTPE